MLLAVTWHVSIWKMKQIGIIIISKAVTSISIYSFVKVRSWTKFKEEWFFFKVSQKGFVLFQVKSDHHRNKQ